MGLSDCAVEFARRWDVPVRRVHSEHCKRYTDQMDETDNYGCDP